MFNKNLSHNEAYIIIIGATIRIAELRKHLANYFSPKWSILCTWLVIFDEHQMISRYLNDRLFVCLIQIGIFQDVVFFD